MKNTFIKLTVFILPLLSILMFSCKEEDEVSYWELKPEIKEISALAGTIGSEVTLGGVNLGKVNKVVFGSVVAEDFSVSENSITATVPDGVFKGELNIAVYSPDGSDRTPFTVLFSPSITELSTDEAFPGEEVVITGADMESVTGVTFGGVVASFTATANSITTTVPLDAPLGEIQITLTNIGGTAKIPFTVTDDPLITSFPASGAIGDVITISGVNFIDVQSLTIGGVESEFTVKSSTELSFVVPEGATTGFIVVTTANGEDTSAKQFIIKTGNALPILIYDEGLDAEWEVWGWGNTNDLSNQEEPFNGSYAIKVNYEGVWSGFSLHPKSSLDLAEYETITLSIFGAAGVSGNVQLYIQDESDVDYGHATFNIVEGEYTTFTVKLSDIGNPPNLKQMILQDMGTENNVIYVDAIILQ